jgi:hypothetical protein
MKWWIKALLASLAWIALCIGSSFFIYPGPNPPELDARLSEILGEVCGVGLVGVWLLFAWLGGIRVKKGGD